MREFQKLMFPENNPIMDRIFAGDPEYKLDYDDKELPNQIVDLEIADIACDETRTSKSW